MRDHWQYILKFTCGYAQKLRWNLDDLQSTSHLELTGRHSWMLCSNKNEFHCSHSILLMQISSPTKVMFQSHEIT
jgi:hypothetical protein